MEEWEGRERTEGGKLALQGPARGNAGLQAADNASHMGPVEGGRRRLVPQEMQAPEPLGPEEGTPDASATGTEARPSANPSNVREGMHGRNRTHVGSR